MLVGIVVVIVDLTVVQAVGDVDVGTDDVIISSVGRPVAINDKTKRITKGVAVMKRKGRIQELVLLRNDKSKEFLRRFRSRGRKAEFFMG